MRRVTLLPLLALALPTGAIASTISFDTGRFVSGTASRTVTGGFAAGNTTLFTDTLTNGMVTKSRDSAVITASLAGLPPGAGTVKFNFLLGPGTSLLAGSVAGLRVVAEPGALALLGTGLIGLAGIARRKLRPGTLGAGPRTFHEKYCFCFAAISRKTAVRIASHAGMSPGGPRSDEESRRSDFHPVNWGQ